MEFLDVIENADDETRKSLSTILEELGLTKTSTNRLLDRIYTSTIVKIRRPLKMLFSGESTQVNFGNCSWSKSSGKKRKTLISSSSNSDRKQAIKDTLDSLKKEKSQEDEESKPDPDAFIYPGQIAWTYSST